jgi:hypothetical protein
MTSIFPCTNFAALNFASKERENISNTKSSLRGISIMSMHFVKISTRICEGMLHALLEAKSD